MIYYIDLDDERFEGKRIEEIIPDEYSISTTTNMIQAILKTKEKNDKDMF